MWIQGIAAVGKEKKKKKPDDQAAQSLEAWLSLPFADLVSACAGAGLPTTGTLEVLADRLHCYYRDVASHQAIASAQRVVPYTSTSPGVQVAAATSMASVLSTTATPQSSGIPPLPPLPPLPTMGIPCTSQAILQNQLQVDQANAVLDNLIRHNQGLLQSALQAASRGTFQSPTTSAPYDQVIHTPSSSSHGAPQQNTQQQVPSVAIGPQLPAFRPFLPGSATPTFGPQVMNTASPQVTQVAAMQPPATPYIAPVASVTMTPAVAIPVSTPHAPHAPHAPYVHRTGPIMATQASSVVNTQQTAAMAPQQLGITPPSMVQAPAQDLNALLRSLNSISSSLVGALSAVQGQGITQPTHTQGSGPGVGHQGVALPCAMQALAAGQASGPVQQQQLPPWQQPQQQVPQWQQPQQVPQQLPHWQQAQQPLPQMQQTQQPLPQWQQAQQLPQPHGSFLHQPAALINDHAQFHSSAVSLGAFPGVPSRFITQIQRGEFVNFDSLYSAILHGSSGRQGYSLSLDDKADSDMLSNSQSYSEHTHI